MPKFVAPANMASFTADTVEYVPDENGHVEIRHPDHVAKAYRHGFLLFDPEAGVVIAPPAPERVPTEVEAENDTLRQQLAEMKARAEASEAALAAAGTDTAEDTADTSGDTSETAEGTAEDADLIGAALAENPDFDEMGRDDMVAWLKGVGVVISPSVSTVAARKAVDETIADYRADEAK